MLSSCLLLATLATTFLVTAVDCDRFLGQTPFRAYASRSAAPGTALYQFLAQDNGLTNYTLVSGGYPFTLNESTGVLRTKTYFPRSGPSWYELEVRATDAGKQQLTATINVTITPEWVLAPALEHYSYTATVTENAALQNNLYFFPAVTGTRITVVRGFSLRPAQITNHQYRIVAGNRGDDLTIDSNGVLSSGKALDRERTSTYHLVVRYTDGVAVISVPVNITVADVNDNFPAFSQDLFTYSLSENSAVDRTIAILNAVDRDAGENGTVTYSIGDFNNCSYLNVDPVSGALVITAQPNYEQWPTCTLVVVGKDGGTPPLSAKAIVSVVLSNVDDECPKFVNSEYSVGISWNSSRPPSSAISLTFLRAVDPDNFTAGIVYSLESRNKTSALFNVNASTGELVLLPTTGDPTGVYALNVSAKDLTCRSYVRVTVAISSPNLHPPRFAQRTMQVNMTENPPQGTIVAILSATDADAGSNGAITFSLASPSAMFAVNYSTGVVYTIGVPSLYDFEMGPPTLSFVVLAIDGGGKIDDCLLQVALINQNDNAPSFPVSYYNISVLRNSILGVTVLQVIASDPDPGSGGLVRYLLSSSGQPFSIGITSGNITTTGSVSGNSYLLVVTAQDQAPPFNNGTILVSIMTVTTQPPVWLQTFYQASIMESASPGTSVLTTAANTLQPTYRTSGINYRSNQSPSTFSIDPSGVISVGMTSNVNHQLLKPFSDFLFVVSAAGICGSSMLCTSVITVRIVVSKTNNYLLQFSQTMYTAAVLEGQDVGTFVTFIQATDVDFNHANYTLSGTDKFSISTEGILRSAAIFNATDGPYLFKVTASYLNQNAIAFIKVTIIAPPQFNDSSPVLLLSEDTHVGSNVFSATDYSLDNDPTALLTFSIMGANQDTFIMNTNGTMLLAQQLDYEQQSAYNLTIQVFDGKHTAHTTLSVIVVKALPTIFVSKNQWGELVENCPAGTFVVTMNYSTVPIVYQLLGEAQGRFAVSSEGRVTVAGDIDRESLLPNAQVIFQAVIQSDTTLYTTNVTINVLDENDCYPNFQYDYTVWIQENTVPAFNGSYVTQVEAVDLDARNNASITYTFAILSGTESGFSINPVTGVIITHFEYNREQAPEYVLLVQARDSGTPMQLSSTALVLVEIGDVNDNVPAFPCSPMYARVLEHTPNGTIVFTFVAIDHDKGPNGTVTFGIVSDNSSGLFVLDASMQGLKLTAPLGYGAESSHMFMFMFTVSLHDNGVPALTGTPGILLVEVLQTNTIAPSFTCTVLENFNHTVYENTPTGTTVANVAASSPSAVLSYAITRGNERGDFRLSIQWAGSSLVQIAKELSYTLAPSYELTIVANDDSNPPLSSSCILSLTIGNVYNLAPLFRQTIYDGSVYENSGPNARILVVSAIARSSGYITGYYFVSADSTDFILNSTSGELGTNASFNRDIRSQYLLTVSAVDSFSLSNTATVVIKIDPSPKDGVIQIQLMSLDNLTPTHELGTVKLGTSDNTICTNCAITTENTSLFSVNRSTCVLSVLQPGPPPGVYTLGIRGNCTNSAYTNTTSTAAIKVSNIFSSEIPIKEIVVLSLHTTASLFLSYGGWTDFPIAMTMALSANITLLSIQASTNDPNTADVVFYAQTQSGYLSQTRILQDIFLKRDMLASLGYRVWNLPSDPCANSPCLNLGSCIPFKNITHEPNVVTSRWQILSNPQVELGYQCSCLAGSAGTLCEINFDDCYSNPCQGLSTCVDGLQAFTCICPPWSTGETCSILIDDCLPGYYGNQCQYQYFVETSYCTPNPCQNGATCSSGRDSFTCYCPVGFTGEHCNKTVTYQGGCVQNPCLHGSTCQQDSSSSPMCTCSAGFTGPTCCWPLDSCELQPCKNGGTCVTGLYGSYLCICAPGHRGVNCTELVPACDSAPCMNGGWCSEAVNGSFTCVCPHQFFGPVCENPVMPEDLCASFPCGPTNNSTCTFGRTGYTCSCPNGFLAPNCSSPAQLPCESAPCLHGGSCTNYANSYVCNCSQGFGGNQCSLTATSCASFPCQNGGTCFDGIGAYSCRCKMGLSGPTCGVYCPSGYTGDHCDEKILYCTSNPCLNGGSCTEGAVEPTCRCPPDFTGPRCQTDCKGPGTTCNLAVSFGGSRNQSSYRTYAPLAFNSQGRVSLEFATIDLNGLLLYSAQFQEGSLGNYFAVEVEDGYLKVSVALVGGAPIVLKSSNHVNDGSWHEMDFTVNNKEFSVLLDYCNLLGNDMLPYAPCANDVTVPSDQSSLNLGLPLWLGGVPFSLNDYSIITRGITACVRYLKVNGELVPIEGPFDQLNSQIGCSQLNNSCQPGVCGAGVCLESWNGFRCVCPSLKGGPQCNQAAEQFTVSSGGYQQYSLQMEGVRSTYADQMELWFMTGGGGGVLFHLGSTLGEYATVELVSGLVTFSTDLGGGALNITASGQLTNDSQWHHVKVNRTALRMSLTVDNVSFVSTFSGLYATLEVDPTMIYAGGYPGSQTITEYFSGCMQDIRLDSYPLPVVGSNQNSIVTSTVGTHPGCGPCSLNPCGTGSCSVSLYGTVLCTCPDGTTLTTHPCSTSPLPILGLYIGAFVGFILVISSIALTSIIAWRCRHCQGRRKPLPSSYYSATTREMDTLIPFDALVIANDTGCGEEDTAVDDPLPGPQSIDHALPTATVEVPVRSDSPMIAAVLQQLVEYHRRKYTDLDLVRQYNEEGGNSSVGSLSSVCSEMEREAYSIDWLKSAGPQFKNIAPVLRHLLTTNDHKDTDMVTNL